MTNEGEPRKRVIDVDPAAQITKLLARARSSHHTLTGYIETELEPQYGYCTYGPKRRGGPRRMSGRPIGGTFFVDSRAFWGRHTEVLFGSSTTERYNPKMMTYYFGGLVAVAAHLPKDVRLQEQVLMSEARPALAAGVTVPNVTPKQLADYQAGLDEAFDGLPDDIAEKVNLAALKLSDTVWIPNQVREQHEQEAMRGFMAMTRSINGMFEEIENPRDTQPPA